MPEKATLNGTYKLWLAIIWSIAQMVFLYARGIQPNGEAQTYIHFSDAVVAAKSLSVLPVNYFLYISHIALLVFLKAAGLSYSYIYIANLLVGTLGLVCFIKLLQLYTLAPLSIFISAILLCICPFFQEWSCFLYTDYLFANLLLIAVFLLVKSSRKPKMLIYFYVTAMLLSFYRPVGFLIFPVAIVYWFSQKATARWFNILLSTFLSCVILYFIWYCLNHSQGYFYPKHNTEANIICGYPSNLTQYIHHPYNEYKSIAYFFFTNPSLTWRLFLYRLYKAYWMTRPYFSTSHNAALSVVLIFYYALFTVGILAVVVNQRSKSIYLFAGLAMYTTPILLFCADWDNRFILPALVFVFIIIAWGIDFIVRQFITKRSAHY